MGGFQHRLQRPDLTEQRPAVATAVPLGDRVRTILCHGRLNRSVSAKPSRIK